MTTACLCPQDTLKARAASAKTTRQIQEMISSLNTSNAVVAFDKVRISSSHDVHAWSAWPDCLGTSRPSRGRMVRVNQCCI